MTHQSNQRDRKAFAPIAFALFILAMGVATWFLGVQSKQTRRTRLPKKAGRSNSRDRVAAN